MKVHSKIVLTVLDIMEIISKHFNDPSIEIRGYSLEFYLILAELFFDFDSLDGQLVQEYLQNPETYKSQGKNHKAFNH
jgi:hypothetical protein